MYFGKKEGESYLVRVKVLLEVNRPRREKFSVCSWKALPRWLKRRRDVRREGDY